MSGNGIEFYAIDTESNGLKVDFHELTQLCGIRVRDKMQFSRTMRCHYPERAQADALRITGKTFDDLRQGDEKLDVIEAFENFLASDGRTPKARCIIAHNASFDRRFLHALWRQHNRVFPAELWLDTMSMARSFAKKQGIIKPKLGLDATIEMVGAKKVAGMHNAVSDSQNLFFVWRRLNELGEDYLEHVKHIPHIISGTDDNDSSDL